MESNDVKTRDVKATAFPPWMPGQFEYEGKQFAGVFSAEIYEQMKTFKYQDTDIIVATYPKSGRCCLHAQRCDPIKYNPFVFSGIHNAILSHVL